MGNERVHPLDAEALALFARKGEMPGVRVPQSGMANGLKVRRVLQLTHDLLRGDLRGRRILDLGCGEGVYAIEAALHGAEVLALDARIERMALGAATAKRHGIGGVTFAQRDVRTATRDSVGSFDAVYALGILYHLDAPDLFVLLANLRELCTGFMIVDTLIAPDADTTVEWEGLRYEGRRVREHEDRDSAQTRRARVLRSIDNSFAFRFTRSALVHALHAAGFSSVLECLVPFEPDKAPDRITLLATCGQAVGISTYPWVNGKTEGELASALAMALGEAASARSDDASR